MTEVLENIGFEWDEWLWELKTDRLKENSEAELKQVSVCGSNITKNNGGIVDKVSGGSNTSNCNDEIMLNKNNNDIVENGVSKNDTVSNGENKSRKLVGVSNGVMISIDAVSYTHLDVYKRQEYSLNDVNRVE